jgi:hypothetical protein
MPEDELWSYELGGKWRVAGSVSLELAVYRIDWQDAQIANLLVDPTTGITTTIISGGNDVEGTGIDFGITWQTAIDGLSLQLSGNVNETEFTKTPPNTVAVVGDQIPGAPPKSLYAALNYGRPVGSLEFSSNVSWGYRDEQREMTTGTSSDTLEDLRMRFGLGGKHWDAAIYGTNLTNQKGVAAVLSAAVVNPIQPRKFGVEANFRF